LPNNLPLPTYDYLKDVLTRLPAHKASRIEEMLPHRWRPANI
jgi:transposase